MRFKKYCLINILFFLVVAQVYSQNFTEDKTYVYQFPLNPRTTVEISNKYGKVQLLTWDIDSVRVDIDFYISSPSTTRMDKLKQNITFDASYTNYYAGVKTVFGRKPGGVIDEIKGLADILVNGSSEIRIDYIVHIPQKQPIRVTNKYGDIYCDDLSGEVQLNLSNGDLKANNFKGNTQISLSFGKGFINEFDKGRLITEYGDLDIRSAENISLESKSSKIRFEKAGMIKLSSRRDDLVIGEVNSVIGDSYFSTVHIENINEELNLVANFGKISADGFRKGFSFINLNSEYADFDLYFDRGATFDFDISYFKDVVLRLPKNAEKVDDKALTPDNLQRVVYGQVGSNPTGKVKINASKKCYINLYTK